MSITYSTKLTADARITIYPAQLGLPKTATDHVPEDEPARLEVKTTDITLSAPIHDTYTLAAKDNELLLDAVRTYLVDAINDNAETSAIFAHVYTICEYYRDKDIAIAIQHALRNITVTPPRNDDDAQDDERDDARADAYNHAQRILTKELKTWIIDRPHYSDSFSHHCAIIIARAMKNTPIYIDLPYTFTQSWDNTANDPETVNASDTAIKTERENLRFFFEQSNTKYIAHGKKQSFFNGMSNHNVLTFDEQIEAFLAIAPYGAHPYVHMAVEITPKTQFSFVDHTQDKTLGSYTHTIGYTTYTPPENDTDIVVVTEPVIVLWDADNNVGARLKLHGRVGVVLDPHRTTVSTTCNPDGRYDIDPLNIMNIN